MAHWIIEDKGFGGSWYRCSECGEGYWDVANYVAREDNCPHCNALIDTDENEYIDDRPRKMTPKWNPKTNPMTKVRLNTPNFEFYPETLEQTVMHKLMAQVIDAADTVVVEAITNAAKEAGVTDLYLIDKEFILSAIHHEMERRKHV